MANKNKFKCPVCGAGDSGWGIGGHCGLREHLGTIYTDGFQESRLFITYNCGSQYIVHTRRDGLEFELKRPCIGDRFNPLTGFLKETNNGKHYNNR